MLPNGFLCLASLANKPFKARRGIGSDEDRSTVWLEEDVGLYRLDVVSVRAHDASQGDLTNLTQLGCAQNTTPLLLFQE